MAVKPLKDLMEEADRLLGQTKQASAPAVADEVSSLADSLIFASQIENQYGLGGMSPEQREFEKVARAINKVAAEAEIQAILQIQKFSGAALEQGYTQAQIDEALEKVAAKVVKKNLKTLTALGLGTTGGEDENSLKPRPVKAEGEEKRRLPLTSNFRGGR